MKWLIDFYLLGAWIAALGSAFNLYYYPKPVPALNKTLTTIMFSLLSWIFVVLSIIFQLYLFYCYKTGKKNRFIQ